MSGGGRKNGWRVLGRRLKVVMGWLNGGWEWLVDGWGMVGGGRILVEAGRLGSLGSHRGGGREWLEGGWGGGEVVGECLGCGWGVVVACAIHEICGS